MAAHRIQTLLLVGNVPLENESAVFRCVASILGGRRRAIPDGETGERTHCSNWQKAVMDRSDILVKRRHVDVLRRRTSRRLRTQ